MVPARQVIVLVTVGLVAAVMGFAGAAALESPAPPAVAIPPEPTAPPEEILLDARAAGDVRDSARAGGDISGRPRAAPPRRAHRGVPGIAASGSRCSPPA